MADIELVIKIPDHLYKLLKEFPSDSNESNIENVLMKAVEHSTPLPKGHWIESDYGNMITQHRWYCSECGGMHNDSESGEWREVFDFKYDYCPLCGAKMAEQEET